MVKTFFGHPVGLSTLFATEMWERFSYYGMRALLILFLTAQLAIGGFGMDELEAYTIYGIFTAMVYITPILGGILADKWLGERKLIYAGGITKAIGHFTLATSAAMPSALAEVRQPLFFAGLAILILGNGFFKPNISTMVGKLYDNNDPRKDGGFTIFYMGINLGAFLAPMIAGSLGENVAWHYGFLTTGFGMLIGTVWFYFRNNTLGRIGMPPSTSKEQLTLIGRDWLDILAVVALSVAISYGFIYGWSYVMPMLQQVIIWGSAIAGVIYLTIRIWANTKGKTEWSRVGVIMILALFNIFFFSGFEQAGTTFNVFARDNVDRIINVDTIRYFFIAIAVGFAALGFFMRLKGKKSVVYYSFSLGVLAVFYLIQHYALQGDTVEIASSNFQSINALAIFIFAPLFTIMWARLDKWRANPSTPMKFGWGIMLLSAGFVVMAIGDARSQGGVLVSPMWLVMVYLLHTFGELCLSPIGLSMVTKLSPVKLGSTMMGVWLGSFAFGNFLGAKMKSIAILYDLPLFWFIAAETFIAALILMALSPWLLKMMKGIK